MADLKVTPDYLVQLSGGMGKWTTDNLAPAVGAVPVDWDDWTPVKIAGAATALAGGLALGGAVGYNWSSIMAKQFTVKGVSFTGAQAWAVFNFAKTGYSIYSKLSSGDYYDAALSAVGLLPQGVNFAMMRTGITDLLKSAKVETPILDYADYVITGLTYACGMGDDSGEAFTDGAKKFSGSSTALQQLLPKSEWTGTASTQYAEVVKQLQKLMGDVAKADTQMAQILKLEQEQLDLTRQVLATTSKTISIAKPIALLLYFSPDGGPAKSKAFQIVIAASTLSVTLAAVGLQVNQSFENSANMDALRPAYDAVKNAADKLVPGSGQIPGKLRPGLPPVPAVPTGGPFGPTIPLGSLGTFSVSGSNRPVTAGAPRSTVAGPTTSGSESGAWLDGGDAPDGLGAPVPAAAPAGVAGGMPTAGSGGPIASQGGKHRSPSVKSDEAFAADEANAAEAGADPRAYAGAGVAGAERAPVDSGAAAPEALDQTSASKPS